MLDVYISPIVHRMTSHGHLSIQTPIHAELLKGPILTSQIKWASCIQHARMVVQYQVSFCLSLSRLPCTCLVMTYCHPPAQSEEMPQAWSCAAGALQPCLREQAQSTMQPGPRWGATG